MNHSGLVDLVQITNPEDLGTGLPPSTSEDAGKVLTVDSNGEAEWAAPATPSVDEVPPVSSSDDGKVLTASYSGGVGSYAWQTAQGGGTQYVGAPAVRVLDNVIDVNIGGDLEYSSTANAKASTISVYYEEYYETLDVFDRITTLDATLCNTLDAGAIKVLGLNNIAQIIPRPGASLAQYIACAIVPLDNGAVPETPSSKLVFNYVGNNGAMLYGAVLSLDNLTSESNLAWSTIKANPTSYALVIMRSDSSGSTTDTMYGWGDEPLVNADTIRFAVNNSYIKVINPLPGSYSGISGNVLTVDLDGRPAWIEHKLGTVKSILKVNSLPASPDANTLYLLPET
jgi:hypothetical protein